MDGNPIPPQQSGYSQRSLPRSTHQDSKWEVWVRALFSFLLGLFSAAFFAGGKSRDVSDLLTWKGETKTALNEIAARFDRMDREGTTRSHWVDESQSNEIAAIKARLDIAEHGANQRGEQIEVMKGKFERIESEISEIKNKK